MTLLNRTRSSPVSSCHSSSATSPSNASTSAGRDHADAAFNFSEEIPQAPQLFQNDAAALPASSPPPVDDDDQTSAMIDESQMEFWMLASQTKSGAMFTDRMNAFMKAVASAQNEFAEKLAAISASEMSRIKSSSNSYESPIFAEYWTQVQATIRLSRSFANSSKDMSSAIKKLIVPMDRLASVGHQRLKETRTWNDELTKALSVFLTNITKREAKCYKTLGSVMTPDIMQTGESSRKARAVRRAVPSVQRYVEQIDEANDWLCRYMERRPALMNRLRALEQKRLQVSREVLTTYAMSMQSMGSLLLEGGRTIALSTSEIDDEACIQSFLAECRHKTRPHLENPPVFKYLLPVPIEELGLAPIKVFEPTRLSVASTTHTNKRVSTAFQQSSLVPITTAENSENETVVAESVEPSTAIPKQRRSMRFAAFAASIFNQTSSTTNKESSQRKSLNVNVEEAFENVIEAAPSA